MALLDGALLEILILTLYGVISLTCFLIFESCKKVLVDSILE